MEYVLSNAEAPLVSVYFSLEFLSVTKDTDINCSKAKLHFSSRYAGCLHEGKLEHLKNTYVNQQLL